MEIPAYARIGVQSGRSPDLLICSIAYPDGLTPGIVIKIAINEYYRRSPEDLSVETWLISS